MEATDLEVSMQKLESLARLEYHASLAEITAQPADSDEFRMLRLGRLLGVTLKKPFATSKVRDTPSKYTGAYRAWELRPESFNDPQVQNSWEYRALETLRSDPDVIRSLGYKPVSVYDLAIVAQTERGFFWHLAMSCRRYVCDETELRSQIEREVEAAKQAGIDLKKASPELIVASGGLAIGTALIQSIPVLGMMGAPVIAGMILIVYRIGIDAFCRWADDHEHYHPDFPNPDEDESTSAQS